MGMGSMMEIVVGIMFISCVGSVSVVSTVVSCVAVLLAIVLCRVGAMVYTSFMCILMLISLMGGVFNLMVDIFVVVVVISCSMFLSLSIVTSMGTVMILMSISMAGMF